MPIIVYPCTYTAKGGIATIACQATVDHSRRALAITNHEGRCRGYQRKHDNPLQPGSTDDSRGPTVQRPGVSALQRRQHVERAHGLPSASRQRLSRGEMGVSITMSLSIYNVTTCRITSVTSRQVITTLLAEVAQQVQATTNLCRCGLVRLISNCSRVTVAWTGT